MGPGKGVELLGPGSEVDSEVDLEVDSRRLQSARTASLQRSESSQLWRKLTESRTELPSPEVDVGAVFLSAQVTRLEATVALAATGILEALEAIKLEIRKGRA